MREMMEARLVQLSKLISLVLRHAPEKLGLTLDSQGWVAIDTLLAAAQQHGYRLDDATLQTIVAANEKQRFAISADGLRIRANQGHSVGVDLALTPQTPPAVLYHGTATRFLESIRATGLERRSRQHVHLSATYETAHTVGQRHGSPIVLIVAAAHMVRDGHTFYQAENGVWLTEHVPVAYVEIPKSV
jgi:putative RNA 2'-phosphotransferase